MCWVAGRQKAPGFRSVGTVQARLSSWLRLGLAVAWHPWLFHAVCCEMHKMILFPTTKKAVSQSTRQFKFTECVCVTNYPKEELTPIRQRYLHGLLMKLSTRDWTKFSCLPGLPISRGTVAAPRSTHSWTLLQDHGFSVWQWWFVAWNDAHRTQEKMPPVRVQPQSNKIFLFFLWLDCKAVKRCVRKGSAAMFECPRHGKPTITPEPRKTKTQSKLRTCAPIC